MRVLTHALLLGAFLLATDDVSCKSNVKKATVLVGILVRNKAHTLPYFLTLLEGLDYPKDRMTLCIRSDNNIDDTLEILKLWLDAHSHNYHAVDLIIDEESSGIEGESGIADWPSARFRHVIKLREEILNVGRKIWADYIFMLDADVFLTNPKTLDLLISKNEAVVAPLVKSDGMYSNFWAGMTGDHYYLRTERYTPILNREDVGCHRVPMVHSAVMIDLKRQDSDLLTYNFEKLKNYDGPADDIIAFALGANMSQIPMHVCNDQVYGYVMVPLENEDSLANDLDQLTNLKLEILARQESLPLSKDLNKFVKYRKKDTLGFDKIYMINLLRRPERRARMEKCFRELGILAEPIDAVDGRTLNESTLKEWGVTMMPDYVDPYHKRPMKMGEIGCFLSHYLVWKKVVDNSYERVMVLEDDIRFEPHFRYKIKVVIRELERLKTNWDLVYIGRKRMQEQEEPLVNGSKILVHAGYSYWTLGYLLSGRGAKKLLDARPLDHMVPVDEYLPILFDQHPRVSWKEYFPKRDLVALSVTPLVVYPTHYTGESGYVSDTEDSKVVAADTLAAVQQNHVL